MQIMNYYDEKGKYVQIYGASTYAVNTLGKSGCLVNIGILVKYRVTKLVRYSLIITLMLYIFV